MIPFKQIYFAGCSHTVGKGLEDAKPWYSKMGITYETERDASYTSTVCSHFNLPKIDNSMCGSGVIKAIKDFYTFIETKGMDEALKTLFIFQFNESPFRVNEWSNDLEKDFNMYVAYEGTYIQDVILIDQWLLPGFHSENRLAKFNPKRAQWVHDFYDPNIYERDIKRQLIGFISYLHLHGINFIFTCEYFDSSVLGSKLSENQFMPFGYKSICNYATVTKTRLLDITDVNDEHPSLEAHNSYANELITYILKKYS